VQSIVFYPRSGYALDKEVVLMLSENIYTLRRKSGLSQEQLAEKLGVSRQAVSKWEGGLSTPELEKLRALSEFFHISIDELTNDRGTPSPPGRADQDLSTEKKVGAGLCAVGAVCLILFGILMILRPSSIEQLDGSSTVTLKGTGLLIALFLLFMAAGIILIFKKK
jgi:transcriptional regulator with XRE-family HTH domain